MFRSDRFEPNYEPRWDLPPQRPTPSQNAQRQLTMSLGLMLIVLIASALVVAATNFGLISPPVQTGAMVHAHAHHADASAMYRRS